MTAAGFAFDGIDHVRLAAPAGCEAEARAFYHGVLGMTEVEKPSRLRLRGGVWFQCGAQQVHIGIEPAFAPARKAHPAFVVRNLSALRRHLLAAGITLTDDGALPDVERFYVDDPFGNRLEFLERAA